MEIQTNTDSEVDCQTRRETLEVCDAGGLNSSDIRTVVVENMNGVDSAFDSTRFTDLSYCLEIMSQRFAAYNATKSKRAQIQLHEKNINGRSMFGVVDMMFCVGSYNSRESASTVWRVLRSTSEHRVRRLAGGVFWVETTAHSQKMDFCTLADFLDHLLPHVTGPLAASIKLARSRTSTLVGTGSDLAIQMTVANAESVQNATEPVRNMVRAVREEVEEKMIEGRPVDATCLDIVETIPRELSCVVIPPLPIIIIKYTGQVPSPGYFDYHRVSLMHCIDDIVNTLPGKITLDIEKIGMSGDFKVRRGGYEYGKDRDFGFFRILLETKNHDNSKRLEDIKLKHIGPARIGQTEYYSVEKYNRINQVYHKPGDLKDASKACWRDLFAKVLKDGGHLITAIYKAKTTVEVTEVDGVKQYTVHVAFRKEDPPVVFLENAFELESATEAARIQADVEKARIEAQARVEVEKARIEADLRKSQSQLEAETAKWESTNTMFSKALEHKLDSATLTQLFHCLYGREKIPSVRIEDTVTSANLKVETSAKAEASATQTQLVETLADEETPSPPKRVIHDTASEKLENETSAEDQNISVVRRGPSVTAQQGGTEGMSKGYKANRQGTAVAQIDAVTNKIIAVHRSIADVKKAISFRKRTDGIRQAIINKTAVQGFLFRLATDAEKSMFAKRIHVNARAIVQIDVSSGEVLREFDTIKEATQAVKKHSATLHGALNGKSVTCAGYLWQYKDLKGPNKDFIKKKQRNP